MKLQLDTSSKTIKLDQDVKFSDLMKVLNRLLPGNEWRDWTLQTNVTINNWTTPIIVEHDRPFFPYEQPWYNGTGTQPVINSGGTLTVHNIDYKL